MPLVFLNGQHVQALSRDVLHVFVGAETVSAPLSAGSKLGTLSNEGHTSVKSSVIKEMKEMANALFLVSLLPPTPTFSHFSELILAESV